MVPALLVHIDLDGDDLLVGSCRFSLRRGVVSTTFTYDPSYLGSSLAFPIDPFLPLSGGPVHAEGLPGALRDSSPGRRGQRADQGAS